MESAESFSVVLSNPSNGVQLGHNTAQVSITDDDVPSTPSTGGGGSGGGGGGGAFDLLSLLVLVVALARARFGRSPTSRESR